MKPKIFEEFKNYFMKVFHNHTDKMKLWDYEQWRKIIYLVVVKYYYKCIPLAKYFDI
jgi:hypothetical protein